MAALPIRYSKLFVALHWLTALLIVCDIAIGLIFADMPRGPEKYGWFRLHASLGITVLMLGIALAALRLGRSVPPMPIGMPLWMRIAARGSHDLLYTLIVLIPLAGYLMVSVAAGDRPVPFFSFDLPAAPFLSDLSRFASHEYHEAFETLHVTAAFAMMALIPIHVGAALYHQYWLHDGVLARMVPWMKISS